MQIVGTITLTTHAHQTAPDGREGNRNETIKTWVFCSDGTRRQIPFITANSIRGNIRRKAADLALTAVNQPVSRQLFHNLTRGAADRAGIGGSDGPSVPALTEGGRNIFAGLFGGGPFMLHSRYTMGPMLPVVAWCEQFIHPALRPNLITEAQLRGKNSFTGEYFDAPLTMDLILTGRDDLLSGKGEGQIKDYEMNLKAWLDTVISGNAAKAESKAAKAAAKKEGKAPEPAAVAGKSSDLRAFNFIEAMLPGTPLQFWLRFKKAATDAQIGLMLLAVRDWANSNELGGASARGFGRFEANLALYDGDTCVAQSIFRIGDHATAYQLSEEVDRYVLAAQKALDELTIEQLEAAYPSKPDAKEAA